MTVHEKNIATIEPVTKGLFSARLVHSASDVERSQRLRAKMFLGQSGEARDLDSDRFDPICQHVLVENRETSELQACFRFLHLNTGSDVDISYSAQFYDLENLKSFNKPCLEIGRFCLSDTANDANILRLGWAVLTRYVDAHNIGLMFGCSSFEGTNTAPYSPALALLTARHLAPQKWKPKPKAPEFVPFAQTFKDCQPNLKEANTVMPPLLRTYLTMGGWVSDHAVIDRQLGTFHVLTGVEIDAIPPRRAALLRADAM